ncbi:MAG: hypothetical protein OQJ89_15080 [Kangiellaceae bacterium]|nr:hypothetical protein [Kangiellaceae bacterium]MCW8997594.1 hypothetical protein [Kangiellaceae bacterium]MCW9018293.1 hypothetical protein [Kangiellaceae bacterium]
MKTIICFSTLLLFTFFTSKEDKLSRLGVGASYSANSSLSLSFVWEETRKIDFSAILQKVNANYLPVVNVYLIINDVPLVER